MYINTRQPNLTIQGKAGWCLSFTQDVWGTPHSYLKAIDAWNDSSTTNHSDQQPPSDVSVPVYWTYTEAGIQYGHIATWIPGKGVYSSPFDVSYGSKWFSSIEAVTNRINQIAGANSRYLGWSESLSKVQLISKEEKLAVITTEMVVALSLGTQGTQPQSKSEYEQWVGRSDQQSFDDMVTFYSKKGQERQAALEAANTGQVTALKPGVYEVK